MERFATTSFGRGGASTRLACLLAALCLFGLVTRPSWADNELCLECHGDVEMWEDEEPGLFVHAEGFLASVHRELDCVTCHEDLDGVEDFPHAKDLAPVACAECHDEEAERLTKGVHANGVACWDCHGAHEIKKREPGVAQPDLVDCRTCHQEVAARYALSTHGVRLAAGDQHAPFCWDCHGTHEVKSSADDTSRTSVWNVPAMCGQCHQEGSPVSREHEIGQASIFENYSQSIHGEGLFVQGLRVTAVCTSCHTAHDIRPHEDPASSINPANVAATCKKCHGLIEKVHTRVIDGKRWQDNPDEVPICVECHQPHEIRSREYQRLIREQNLLCLDCHASSPNPEMVLQGKVSKYTIDMDAFAKGVHAKVQCITCHAEATAPVERPCMTVQSKVDCAACHEPSALEFQQSTHGQKLAEGDADAPSCGDCHGDTHVTLSRKNPLSPTFRAQRPGAMRPVPPGGGQGGRAHPHGSAGRRGLPGQHSRPRDSSRADSS